MEVRAEEAPWEGAVERLLHNFGLSLLVPDKHYPAVVEWVDKTLLGIRLVYYRVQLENTALSFSRPHPSSVAEKLNIKPDTPFGLWLTRELRQRFPHICCEDMQQFRRETQAMTKAGQIKGTGHRHEKDDRYDINDRKRFILGFSNRRKIAVLEENEQTLKDELNFYQDQIQEIRKEQKKCQDRLNAIAEMERLTDFAEIDTLSKAKEIEEKEQRKRKLEQENDVLKGLQCQLLDWEERKKAQKGVVEEA